MPVAFLCSCPRPDGTLEKSNKSDMFGDEGNLFDLCSGINGIVLIRIYAVYIKYH